MVSNFGVGGAPLHEIMAYPKGTLEGCPVSCIVGYRLKNIASGIDQYYYFVYCKELVKGEKDSSLDNSGRSTYFN